MPPPYRDGGTLVAIRGAARWAVEQGLAPRVRLAPTSPADGAEGSSPARRDFAEAEALFSREQIGGSIVDLEVDVTHPLGFGLRDRRLPVWRDHGNFFEPSTNPYSTVAGYTEEPRLSGFMTDGNLARLRGTASVLADQIGQGRVVLFADNPNFRGYGTNRLFLNALFFGDHVRVPPAP